MPKFVNALERKCGVRNQRKRYTDITATDGKRGPHAVLFLGGGECPVGESEADWLADQINGFRRNVGVFKGEAYD